MAGRTSSLILTLLLLVLAGSSSASALTIEGTFIGGQELGPRMGGGGIVDAFRAAAEIWEHAIRDKFTVHFDYGWGALPGGYHTLQEQSGTPNRETRGTILVNPQVYNDGSFATLFLDPTPRQNKEFPAYQEFAADLGGGPLNIARDYFAPMPDPTHTFQDLLTEFLHEIGHGLGMSLANTSFIAKSADGTITILPPLPCAGTIIPLAFNNAGVTSHIDPNRIPGPTGYSPLMSGWGFNERVYPSALDILAIAQISGFQDVNLEWRGTNECQ